MQQEARSLNTCQFTCTRGHVNLIVSQPIHDGFDKIGLGPGGFFAAGFSLREQFLFSCVIVLVVVVYWLFILNPIKYLDLICEIGKIRSKLYPRSECDFSNS